jgi:hypothetical protein
LFIDFFVYFWDINEVAIPRKLTTTTIIMKLDVNQEFTLRQQFLRLAVITTLAGGLFSLLLVGIFNLTTSPDSIAGTPSADQICYTVSDVENKIYKFKLSDGSVISSKALSSASSVEAATLNLKGDTLWLLNADELHYSLTAGTMANTKISGSDISAQQLSGSIGNVYVNDFDAMGVDENGDLWAGSSDNSPLLLVVLDRSTGNVKEDYFGSGKDYLKIDNSQYSALRFDAMAFDPITNKLYANMNGSSQNYDYLFQINTDNGFMSLIRQFNTIDDVEGMGFDSDGELYVTTGANASSTSLKNTLWHVDLINGEVTKMFAIWGGDMETCDCVVQDPLVANEISGNVFYDEDNDTLYAGADIGTGNILMNLYNDVNANGAYDASTDLFLDSSRTYADGYYRFRRSYSSGTENYVVVIDTSGLPANSFLTTDNIETASFSSGQNIDSNNNFGYNIDTTGSMNIITGTVYADSDEDEVLDPTEVGVSGVKVCLYSDEDCNGSINGSDALLKTSIVGTDGKYSFMQDFDTTSTSIDSISKRVSSSSDDAIEDGSGSVALTGNHLHLGYKTVGVKFNTINIPQGATITEAYIEFTADRDNTGSGSVNIYGEDVDDASTYSSSSYDITSRSKTSAVTNWATTNWVAEQSYNTPDLKSLVQEIVDRNSWGSGNDMAFVFVMNSGHKDGKSYDESSSKAPLLFVKYQTGSNSNGSDCYVIVIDEDTKPSGTYMTTDNKEIAQFTSGGNLDSANDFGIWGGSLPVTWLSFEGSYLGDAIHLNWATGSEENNSHFEIERSVDGRDWLLLTTVNGSGTSIEINRYQSVDNNPNPNINYYRLKQVDFDGAFDYSNTIVLSKGNVNAFNLNVFPNPAIDHIVVTWNKNHRNGQLEVTDLNGHVLQSIETKLSGNIHRFDLSNYDQGVYLVRYTSDNYSSTKKIVLYK